MLPFIDELSDFTNVVDVQTGDYGVLAQGPACQAKVLCAMSKKKNYRPSLSLVTHMYIFLLTNIDIR